ncbi:MAG: hypothetical protein IT328_24035 [Caldilineaceae bacterium]|nr:hypothetical protein [Caldilineaceae bacterium]
MPDFLTLTCPTCGARLQLRDGIALLVCASCGNEHMVHRDGGAIYLAPIAQDVRQIRVSSDRTAAELAIPRLTKELAAINDEINATKARIYFIDHKNVEPLPYGWLLTAVMVMALGIAMVGGINGNLWLVTSMGIIGVGAAAWYLVLNSQRFKKAHDIADRLKQADIDQLKQKYNAKRAALEKNHQIANSL